MNEINPPESSNEKPGNFIYSIIDFLSHFRVLGYLAAAAIIFFLLRPLFTMSNIRGKITDCENNLKKLAMALEMYSCDHSGHYPDNLEAVAPKYIAEIPTCPGAGKDTYTVSYNRYT